MKAALRIGLRSVAVAAAVALCLVAGALAYWTATGTGNASARVGTIAAPTISSATPGAGTVELSWTAVTPPDPGTVTYYVSRDGGEPAGKCPSSSSPSQATSCTDSGVSVGTHEYTVTAKWHSLTATSASESARVSFGPATKFLLNVSTTTPSAGAADNLTITAEDTYGNTVTTYAGSHSLTFGGAATIGTNHPTVTNSSGTVTSFGTATAISFASGIASVSGTSNGVMKLYKAEAAAITVAEGSITNGSGLAVTVGPGSAASLSLAAATTTPSAGAADNLTITAEDTYGNGITGSQNLTFEGAANSPNANVPTVSNSSGTATSFGTATAISFASGIASVSGADNGVMKLYSAGAASIIVSDGSITNGSGLAVTVSPGSASNLAWSHATSSGTLSSPCLFTCTGTGLGSGGNFKANVSVTDSSGNTVTGIGAGYTVSVTSTAGTITGGTLTISATGPAESTAQFTYTPSNGATITLTAATASGTTHTSATASMKK